MVTTLVPVKRARYTVAKKKTAPKQAYGAKPGTLYRTGFPRQQKMSHMYSYNSIISHATGAPTAQGVLFTVNGLFDPEVALGGHQPSYFDQMAALYDHYIVTSATITAEFSPASIQTWTCGVTINDDTSVDSYDLDALCEQPSSTSVQVPCYETRKVTKTWKLDRAFPAGSKVASQFRGDVTQNPTETQSFVVYARPTNGLLGVISCDVKVSIVYHAEWNELRDMVKS